MPHFTTQPEERSAARAEAVAVIPARLKSSRFPGKPLVDQTGKPLIQHVYEQAMAAERVKNCYIATADREIANAVTSFGGSVIMTAADHPNGTSRIAEAVREIEAELIVNVQGDEPEIDPALIDEAVDVLAGAAERCVISTIAAPFARDENPADPNIVKVVSDQRSRALYFSRALIPFDREGSAAVQPMKHVGLYVYRRAFLLEKYVNLPPTPLEQSEQLEQLRVLEHGYDIAVVRSEHPQHAGIDTPDQYAQFVQRYRNW